MPRLSEIVVVDKLTHHVERNEAFQMALLLTRKGLLEMFSFGLEQDELSLSAANRSLCEIWRTFGVKPSA